MLFNLFICLFFCFSENLINIEVHCQIVMDLLLLWVITCIKNEFMFSLRFSKMLMDGMLNGTKKKITVNSVMSSPNGASDGSGRYMNSPLTMRMNMYMFGGMFAPTDNLTLMLMSSYNQKEMNSQRMAMAGGGNFNVNSSGVGDTRFSGLVKVLDDDFFKTSYFALGLSLPTGSINERDTTPASSSARLGIRCKMVPELLTHFLFSIM